MPKRKRVLPKSSMIRIKEIFSLLDDEKKGCKFLYEIINIYILILFLFRFDLS